MAAGPVENEGEPEQRRSGKKRALYPKAPQVRRRARGAAPGRAARALCLEDAARQACCRRWRVAAPAWQPATALRSSPAIPPGSHCRVVRHVVIATTVARPICRRSTGCSGTRPSNVAQARQRQATISRRRETPRTGHRLQWPRRAAQHPADHHEARSHRRGDRPGGLPPPTTHCPSMTAADSSSHLATKPPLGGTPMNDNPANPNATAVTGRARRGAAEFGNSIVAERFARSGLPP